MRRARRRAGELETDEKVGDVFFSRKQLIFSFDRLANFFSNWEDLFELLLLLFGRVFLNCVCVRPENSRFVNVSDVVAVLKC